MPLVTICEMSPRDGVQALNPQRIVPVEMRVRLIRALARAGLPFIEIGAFVSPKAVPQMADTPQVARDVADLTTVQRAALVPNTRYYQAFKGSGCDTAALFVSASERYSQSNLRTSSAAALDAARDVAELARADGYRLRAHLSAAFHDVEPDETSDLDQVIRIYAELEAMGCEVIALADTFGTTHPGRVREVLAAVQSQCGLRRAAVHLHDTLGLGLANALAAFEAGVRIFDASAGGIGGSPFAGAAPHSRGGFRAASGNVATEELACLFERMGVATGIDLDELATAGGIVREITRFTGDPDPPSKALTYLERRSLTSGRAKA